MSRVQKVNKKRQWQGFFFLPVSLLYLEYITKLFIFGFTLDKGTILTALLSLSVGFVIATVTVFVKKRTCYRITAISLLVFAVIFGTHVVYFDFFQSFFSWSTLGMAGSLTQYWRETIVAILKNLWKIALIFAPFILYLIKGKGLVSARKSIGMMRLVALALALVNIVTSMGSIGLIKSNRTLFNNAVIDLTATYRYFGIIGGSISDISTALFGGKEEDVVNPYENTSSTTSGTDEPKPVVYGPNTLNIDFESLIASAGNKTVKGMHEYFSTVPATYKNEYTGYFKGKNLIFLTLEGFSSKCISQELTPTLYKMATEGFVFKNFYDSAWGGSTSTGEYSNMTGNFYTSAKCLEMSASKLNYSALGNMFRTAGYDTYAYHNHTYTYYKRNKSHPNFGYDYKGIGNGVVLEHNRWPNSDRELATATIDEYINSDKPFHTYYMTVSGHANYTWVGNSQSKLHKEDIPASWNYSENVKAYIACNLEVEAMLNELIAKLDAAGKLEDTVFAMCCDHYPYALSDAELAELYNLPESGIRNNYELYRNSFILWSACMEKPVVVDSVCSSYDMAPTLYNLFGIDYDSRIITGKDILSTEEKIVIINTLSSGGSWNWITNKGSYSTTAKKFTPVEGVEMTADEISDYVKLTNQKVAAMRKYAFAILENDYYKYVFNKDFTLKAELSPTVSVPTVE